jgi:hypothetical protein
MRPAGFAAESIALVALGLTLGGFLNQLGAAAADVLIAGLKKLFRRTAEESASHVYRIQQEQVITAPYAGRSIAIRLVQGVRIDLGEDGAEVERLVEQRLHELGRIGDDLLRKLDERIAADNSSSDYCVTVPDTDSIAIEKIADVDDLLRQVDR